MQQTSDHSMNDFPVIVQLAMRTGLWDRWGETLQVATKKCKAWSYFYVKSNVFGHRMSHFAVATIGGGISLTLSSDFSLSTHEQIPCTFYGIFRRCYLVYTKVK